MLPVRSASVYTGLSSTGGYWLYFSRAVSTTVDPFRDISLDLASCSIVNRTCTPFDATGV